MEEAFQATIGWWKSKQEKIDYPSAALIKALNDQWKPFNWQPNWLIDPRFKSPCQKYWEEAEVYWGKDLRNSLIADVVENEKGSDYILFMDGKTLKLSTAKALGWQRVLDYAQKLR